MLLLASCAGLPTRTETPDVRVRVHEALAAPEGDAPWRATVRSIGRYQLIPGRDVYAPEPVPRPFVVDVAADAGEIVWIVHEVGCVRYALGAHRADLARLPVGRTPLGVDGPVEGCETCAEVVGGTPVTIEATRGDAHRVRWRAEGLEVVGWLADSSLGEVWRWGPYDIDARHPDVLAFPYEDAEGDRIPLRTAPDPASPVIARFEYGTANHLYDTRQAREGWRRIEVLTRSARAVGWAPPESVAVGVVNMSGYGEGGGSFGAADVPRVVLPEGTWIRVPGEREPFARTVCDTTLPIRGEPGATVAVEILSSWGWLSGEVTCARPEGSASRPRRGPERTNADDRAVWRVLPGAACKPRSSFAAPGTRGSGPRWRRATRGSWRR